MPSFAPIQPLFSASREFKLPIFLCSPIGIAGQHRRLQAANEFVAPESPFRRSVKPSAVVVRFAQR